MNVPSSAYHIHQFSYWVYVIGAGKKRHIVYAVRDSKTGEYYSDQNGVYMYGLCRDVRNISTQAVDAEPTCKRCFSVASTTLIKNLFQHYGHRHGR